MPSLIEAHTRLLIKIERAINDLRRGFAVAVTPSTKGMPAALVFAADTVSEKLLQLFSQDLGRKAHLVLSHKRINKLFPSVQQSSKPTKIPLPFPINIKELYLLSGLDSSNPIPVLDREDIFPATDAEIDALELVKLSELLPAAVTIALDKPEAWFNDNDVLVVNAEEIAAFKAAHGEGLKEVCVAPLCLMGAENAAIRVYRPYLGGNEHYAIIIGNALKDATPLIRIHSSCYTGDLLRSLRCDCGDQLHEAIRFMGETDSGGIIIYLMQEGRGIGLTNKLRTYDLQAKGFDTVDANELLGFDDDERLFLPAATILKALGFTSIQLLTNNPKKAKGLEEYGIKVSACVPHIMPSHEHNEAYLQTKATRLGHVLPKK